MYNTEDFDVAVIGGGLAGLSLAIQCAGEGFRTLLLEREEYPFHKVCGEYISNESAPFLQRLGIDLPRLCLPRIHQLTVSDAGGKAYHFPLRLGGFGISRFTLDQLLYERALAAGVTVLTNTKVSDVTYDEEAFNILSSAGHHRATVACGAYGKRSNLDIQWKRSFAQPKNKPLINFIGIKYHIRYPHPPGTIALHNFANGYCGISRIEDEKCCLCYLTTANNLKQYHNSIGDMEQQLLSQNPLLKDIFNHATFLYSHPLAISQISFESKTQVENGVLMLGDAAGLITPLCGNGMSMALQASVLAFDSVRLFLKGTISRTKMESRYAAQWKARFAMRLMMGRTIQRVFGGNDSTAWFLRTMQAFPVIANAVVRSTHGKPF